MHPSIHCGKSAATIVSVGTLFILFTILMTGCASLEPLPRFRSTTSSFTSQQHVTAPPPQLNATESITEYSRAKEAAIRKDLAASSPQTIQLFIANQSKIESNAQRVDEIGLDGEELEDELAANEEESSDEPPLDEAAIGKALRTASATAQAPSLSDEDNAGINRENLMLEIVNMLGARYKFGGTNALGGIDCSAFVGTVYSRAVGVRLPRTSTAQFSLGRKVRKDDLLAGDLVFFKTRHRKKAPVSHVGIYVGEDLFAHASRKNGVVISSLDQPYYTKTYVGARRVVSDELTMQKMN